MGGSRSGSDVSVEGRPTWLINETVEMVASRPPHLQI
jgi:hypothetical protein